MLEDYSSPQRSNKDGELLLFLQISLRLASGVAVKREAKRTSDRRTASAYSSQCCCSCAMFKHDT